MFDVYLCHVSVFACTCIYPSCPCLMPREARRWIRISWNCSYRQLRAAAWGLKTGPIEERAASALNSSAISPALSTYWKKGNWYWKLLFFGLNWPRTSKWLQTWVSKLRRYRDVERYPWHFLYMVARNKWHNSSEGKSPHFYSQVFIFPLFYTIPKERRHTIGIPV